MSPDLLFRAGHILKMAITVAIIVIASMAVERSGPFYYHFMLQRS